MPDLKIDPSGFDAELVSFFEYSHLSAPLQRVSGLYKTLVDILRDEVPPSAERTVAIRKLLESKDAAVRAKLLEMRNASK